MGYGVHDRRHNRNHHHLGHAFVRVAGRQRRQHFAGLLPHRHVAGTRQRIAIEVPGAVAGPVLVQRQIFMQSVADAHRQTTLQLARNQFGHDLVAALEHRMMIE